LRVVPWIAEPQALDVLAGDGLIAFPTETVWGLAACAKSDRAVSKLRDFKGRDADKPLSILIDTPERAGDVAADWTASARALAERFWPGPLTLVLKSGAELASGVVAQDGTIGVRCSPHAVATSLAAGAWERGLGPVTATSLNRGGEPAARTAAEAKAVCGDEIPMLEGEATGDAPSTVVDATAAELRVLREGAIQTDALEIQ
jgi:L-threonylcarbamoyladenylate synthase